MEQRKEENKRAMSKECRKRVLQDESKIRDLMKWWEYPPSQPPGFRWSDEVMIDLWLHIRF